MKAISQGQRTRAAEEGGGRRGSCPPAIWSWRASISFCSPQKSRKGPREKLGRNCKEQHYTSSVAQRGPLMLLRGPGNALRGAPVAQGPLRYYQGAPLVALFHSKGTRALHALKGPCHAFRGALSRTQGPSVTRASSLACGAPRLPKVAPSIQGTSKLVCPPPPLENTFRRHWRRRCYHLFDADLIQSHDYS